MYNDLCKRLNKLKDLRKKLDEQLGLPPDTPSPRELEKLQAIRKGGSRGISYDPVTGGYRRTISHDNVKRPTPVISKSRKTKETESKSSIVARKQEMMTMSAKRATGGPEQANHQRVVTNPNLNASATAMNP